jgi:hypothetical protein
MKVPFSLSLQKLSAATVKASGKVFGIPNTTDIDQERRSHLRWRHAQFRGR